MSVRTIPTRCCWLLLLVGLIPGLVAAPAAADAFTVAHRAAAKKGYAVFWQPSRHKNRSYQESVVRSKPAKDPFVTPDTYLVGVLADRQSILSLHSWQFLENAREIIGEKITFSTKPNLGCGTNSDISLLSREYNAQSDLPNLIAAAIIYAHSYAACMYLVSSGQLERRGEARTARRHLQEIYKSLHRRGFIGEPCITGWRRSANSRCP